MTGDVDVVTGAFGYTGRSIAARLLASGRRVRTLTGHPGRRDPFGGRLEVAPYRFDALEAMTESLRGATTLYNTYWVRFDHRQTSFAEAVRHSRRLFEAARLAGVGRVVHISITKPSEDSALPYFRGKALVERALRESGLSHAIVRPTVVFGPGDVLINNIAWLLRRFPVFAIPGDGRYRVRPIHVDDVARMCVERGDASADAVVDAVGPEVLSFEELIRVVRAAVGSRSAVVRIPARLVPVLAGVIGLAVRDVLLTRDELVGLMAEMVHVDGPATGTVRFSRWVEDHADRLGRRYASEIGRHFR